MTRKVTQDGTEPYVIDEDELDEQGGAIYICQCGLSDNKPYCDGSHQATADEEDGVVYEYTEDGDRNVVSDD